MSKQNVENVENMVLCHLKHCTESDYRRTMGNVFRKLVQCHQIGMHLSAVCPFYRKLVNNSFCAAFVNLLNEEKKKELLEKQRRMQRMSEIYNGEISRKANLHF